MAMTKKQPVWCVLGALIGFSLAVSAVPVDADETDILPIGAATLMGGITGVLIDDRRGCFSNSASWSPRPRNANSMIQTEYRNGKRGRKPRPKPQRYVSDVVPEVYLQQISRITHNREVAERLLLQAVDSSYDRDWQWAVDKVRYDLERGR